MQRSGLAIARFVEAKAPLHHFLGVFALALCAFASTATARADQQRQPHTYVTWDRFEVDRCVAAWLIKRFLDPQAEFELRPVGSSVPKEGCIPFDVPGGSYERAPRRSVSEAVWAKTGQHDQNINEIIALVRATEVGFWKLDPASREARFQESLRALWTDAQEPPKRLADTFAYLDNVYQAGDLGFGPVAGQRAPASTNSEHRQPPAYAGLENVLQVIDGVLSGSAPQGDLGFDSLAILRVRTIISVDGAKPDVDRARARSMRYVHIPVGYNGVTHGQRVQLAKAIRDLPKPIYVHCHHGKHRGPTAAATAAIALGHMQPDQGVIFLRKAGTSESYPGLLGSIRAASAIESAILDVTASAFPEVANVSGLTKTMAEIDQTFDYLRAIRAADWRIPPEHPDLVPVAEAARLADLLRDLTEDPVVRSKPEEFHHLLMTAAERASTLEQTLNANAADGLDRSFSALKSACVTCHVKYRD